MADRQVIITTADRYDEHRRRQSHQVTTMTAVLYASLAGVAVGGPLLGMMGFTFLASLTLLLITSPLLIIFSPLLFCAGVVLVTAITGFVAAVAMAVAGVSTFAWIFRSSFRTSKISTSPPLVEFLGSTSGGGGGVTAEKLVESGEKVKEQGKDWAGYLQQKATHDNPSENKAVRG